MKVLHTADEAGGEFHCGEAENKQASLTYKFQPPNMMVILHTAVNEALKGQGVGNKLVLAAADLAREKNWQVLAECSFAAKIFKRDSNLSALLVQSPD